MSEPTIHIEVFTVSSFATNMYVVSSGGEALVVDPACRTACEQDRLLRYLMNAGLTVKAIVATHGHLDHLWGAAWMTDRWHLPVLMDEADIPMAEAMQMQYNMWGLTEQPQPFPLAPLTAERLTECGAKVLAMPQLIRTPGHTRGGVCLYWQEEEILLSCDTLFRNGYGRTDLPGGDTAALIDSLRRLFALPSATRVFPGHGEPTTIGEE